MFTPDQYLSDNNKVKILDPLPSGIEIPEKFTNPFDYTPHEVVRVAASKLTEYLSLHTEWHEELSKGKMFGVLVVRTLKGELGYLAAFSGNLNGQTQHDFFVPPIFDLHAPSSFFRTREAEISTINNEIKRVKGCEELHAAVDKLEQCERSAHEEISNYKAFIKSQKANRDLLRRNSPSPSTIAQFTAESQFQKAELKRIETKFKEEISQLKSRVATFTDRIEELKSARQQLSRELQTDIFNNYLVLNHQIESQSMAQIFKEARNTPPPAGAGECAAPKLLHYAFANNLTPIAMGEFWWGESPCGEVRHHGEFYTSCKGKCEPILGYMLQEMKLEPSRSDYSIKRDLKVLYCDNWLAIVDKPSGMLSVKGRVDTPSVEALLPRLFPQYPDAKVVHRLDMDTSGILLIAFDAKTYSNLQRQFATREISKRYLAIVDGVVESQAGDINLPLSSDYEQRPRQRVDYTSGKEAQTSYHVLSRSDHQTRISLTPHTGRTHQLRLHCAHPHGLGFPIVGDRLYGYPSSRLMLQATTITFTHPTTSQPLTFEIEAEF